MKSKKTETEKKSTTEYADGETKRAKESENVNTKVEDTDEKVNIQLVEKPAGDSQRFLRLSAQSRDRERCLNVF